MSAAKVESTKTLDDQTWGLYVHVPWCRRRCPYCAFYVEPQRDVPWTQFSNALLSEHEARLPFFAGSPTTVYFGGGTPSLAPPDLVAKWIGAFAGPRTAEITLETNPEDVTPQWLDDIQRAGVTRLSLGLQTFHPGFAHLLNRACTIHQARQITEQVADSSFESWSMDIMFALPKQTLDDLARDLDAMLAAEPPHVSLYGLTWEPGTAFTRGLRQGRFEETSDDTWRFMYDGIVERLSKAGLEQYEVSNFAKQRHKSLHNRIYWNDRPYMALGPSAHGYEPDGVRYVNVADVDEYLSVHPPPSQREQPTPMQRAQDHLVAALRCTDGLSLKRLKERTGMVISNSAWQRAVQEGLLIQRGDRLIPATESFPVSDALVRHLASTLKQGTQLQPEVASLHKIH